MLGWHISVFKQQSVGSSPAGFETKPGLRLGVWQTGYSGLDWIDTLVKSGRAIDLGGNGYPMRYTAQKKEIAQQILEGPPEAKSTWSCEPTDILTKDWVGRTAIDEIELKNCDPDEWLLIQAWDES